MNRRGNRSPRRLYAVLDPGDGLSFDWAFPTLAEAQEHCRTSWPGVQSVIVEFVPVVGPARTYTPMPGRKRGRR